MRPFPGSGVKAIDILEVGEIDEVRVRRAYKVAELLVPVLFEYAISYLILFQGLRNRYLGGEEANLTLNVDIRLSATARRFSALAFFVVTCYNYLT